MNIKEYDEVVVQKSRELMEELAKRQGETIDLSQWIAGQPADVLEVNFGRPAGTFDAFPMFSPDGTRLVFASNRRADRQPTRDTNIFVADWVETPTAADRAFAPPRPAPQDETP